MPVMASARKKAGGGVIRRTKRPPIGHIKKLVKRRDAPLQAHHRFLRGDSENSSPFRFYFHVSS